MTRPALLLLAVGLPLAACGGARTPDPDARFGTRYTARDGAPRETLLIAVPRDSSEYLAFPAVTDSVSVRAERPVVPPGDSTAVEVLVKGSLPDACAELSRVAQRRDGRSIRVELDMRTPRRRVCAAVARPYRFYLPLDGHFAPGSYVLTLNGRAVPFQIREEVGR